MKKLIQFILILGIALSAFHCHKKKDDNNKNLLLLLGLYAADQMSGNCATVTKVTLPPPLNATVYNAFLTPIPKGGCNAGTIFGGTTKEEIKNKLKADYTRHISIIDAEFSGQCSATKTTIQTTLNSDSTLETMATQNYNVSKDARYFVLGSMIQEAKNVLINSDPNDEIASAEDVNTLSPASTDDLKKISDYNMISLAASSALDTTCTTAVNTKISQTFPSDKYSTGTYIKKNTKIISASCQYGDAVPEAQKCATLNEKF